MPIVKPNDIIIGGFKFAPHEAVAIAGAGESVSIHYSQAPEFFILKDVPANLFIYESGLQIKTDPKETITELNKILVGYYKISTPDLLFLASNKPQIKGLAAPINLSDFLNEHPWVRFMYSFEGQNKTYNGAFVVSIKGISDHLEFDNFSATDLFSFSLESTLLNFIPPEDGVLKYSVVGEVKSL